MIPISGLRKQVATDDGTASIPSISFSNDLDTGLYRPTTNTLAVSTNATERVRVTSTGSIGIGTTDPKATLHIQGSAVIANACLLYLLDTPIAHEWQYVGSVLPSLKVTYNFGTSTSPKAILADVFLGGTSVSDHQNIVLGRNHAYAVNWCSNRNRQPSGDFGNLARQVVTLDMNGELDNYSTYFGVWHGSQTIPIESNGQLYFSNPGNSGSSGWVYVLTRGYYL